MGALLGEAEAHRAAGRLAEAERHYRRVLDREPAHAGAQYGLGLVADAAGDTARAIPHLVAALRAAPERAPYWMTLSAALLLGGRLPEARALLEQFQRQGFPEAQARDLCRPLVANLYARALRLYHEDRLAEAEALIDTLILLDERHADAINLAANIAGRTGRLERSVDLLAIAIHIDNRNADYFSNLGVAFTNLGNDVSAVSAFEKALDLAPDAYAPRVNLAEVHRARGRYQDSLRHLEWLVARQPGQAPVHNSIAVALKALGRLAESATAFERALAAQPDWHVPLSNLLVLKLYAADVPPEAYFALAREYGRRHADPLRRARPFRNDPDPERRLRVGFVSADLRDHAVACFLEPFLDHFAGLGFETFAYSSNPFDDAVTERLKTRFDHWRDIAGLDDERAADRIEADAIDLLVDLSGHSGYHRLLVFARKPAPVQVTWIGHPATTGLSAMDYRFTDPSFEPEGSTDHLHTETLWRLPRVTACYRPQGVVPDVTPRAPFATAGHITFGCLNRFEKVGDACLATWARVLAAVPDARLLFEIVDIDHPATRADVEARLVAAGMPLARIDFEPRLSANRYVLHNRVDIALDPFPYNGGTTSFDTLYMGVPFVALRGRHTVARMGASILDVAGLPELVADTEDDYVATACRLATDRDALLRLRAGLRERFAASPHMDHAGHAADVADAFRSMWRRWVQARPRALDPAA